MANPDHLVILRQGVEVWNAWRREYPGEEPDLSELKLKEVNFRGIDLRGANLQWSDFRGGNLRDAHLSNANLQWADLIEVDFTGGDLRDAHVLEADLRGAIFHDTNCTGAILTHADLTRAILREAILRGTDLQQAILQEADLTDADLRRANLRATNLVRSDLRGVHFRDSVLEAANMTEAHIGWTVFGSLSFHMVRGLDTVKHHGPSTIGIDTLYKSHGDIPEAFLRGCGVPDRMIEYAHSLVAAEHSLDYSSVFISYSSHDEALAERLYADLQAKGVRCWYAPHHLQIGEPILSGIDIGIQLHDKLLLVLSEASVNSAWVEQEVQMALARERNERRRVLFPIHIDDTVLQQSSGWPALVRNERHIGDFRQWKDHDAYEKAFVRLLRDLKAEPR